LELRLLYPDIHRTHQQGHAFPHKGLVAADASLCLASQKILDDTMVATFTSTIDGRRGFACELSGVGQLSPRDVAPGGYTIHGRRGEKKSRHCQSACLSCMNISVVRNTAAIPNKDQTGGNRAKVNEGSLL
jgi:hypothetical protein